MGISLGFLANGVVDGDQFGSVRKCGLDLNFVNHLCDAFHALVAGDDVTTSLHHVGDGAAISCALDNCVSDQGNGFGVVQLDTAGQPFAGDFGSHGNEQFVFLARSELHGFSLQDKGNVFWVR